MARTAQSYSEEMVDPIVTASRGFLLGYWLARRRARKAAQAEARLMADVHRAGDWDYP